MSNLKLLLLHSLLISAAWSHPLDHWALRNPLPAHGGLFGVAYGNGLFVATGHYGQFLTSPDGVAWTRQKTTNETSFYGICFANGTFVAVGGTPVAGIAATSADGTNWSYRAVANPQSLATVTFGGGLFVAAGDNLILTSPNGTNWSAQPLPFELFGPQFTHAIYAQNKFFVAGYVYLNSQHTSSGIICSSTDGTNWTTPIISSNAWLNSITYGAGKFLAAGNPAFLTSSDGEIWTRHVVDPMNIFDCVHHSSGLFLAFSSGALSTSPDAMTWTRRSMEGAYARAVTYAQQQIVAVGAGVHTSADGLSWTRRGSSFLRAPAHDVAFGEGQFVAVGWYGMIVASPDGVTWTPRDSSTSDSLIGVAYGGDRFVAVGHKGCILVSSNTTEWVDHRPLGTNLNFGNVTYGNGRFVVVGSNPTLNVLTIASSTDGVSWQRYDLQTNYYSLASIAFGDGRFVAVGGRGHPVGLAPALILSSTDGLAWNHHAVPFPGRLNSVAFGGGQFVAVIMDPTFPRRYTNYIFTSSDGANWASVDFKAASNAVAVAYGSGHFVVTTKSSGQVFTSTNGSDWVARNTSVPTWVMSIAFGNGTFVAVSDTGVILQSYDLSGRPRLVFDPPHRRADGSLRLLVESEAGSEVTVETNSFPAPWSSWTNVINATGVREVEVPAALPAPPRIFRARLLSP